jgi:protein transport protein SEC61 subunit alpha
MLTMLVCSVFYVHLSTTGLFDLLSGDYVPILVVSQLFGSSIIVDLLTEILHSGYGITTSAISLFIATKFCETILWQFFSPVVVNQGRGPEFEGAILCLGHFLLTWTNKVRAIEESLFRKSQPNLLTVGASLLLFVVIIYLQGISIAI